MKKLYPLLFLALLNLASFGQITLIGHTKLNNSPLTNTGIFLKEGNTIVKNFNTQKKSDFMLKLDFGKVYRIYFQHANSPVMFLEVVADNIPQDKMDYRMGYELNVPFYNSNDNDIDTAVFKDPFHRVVYNGKTGMTEDKEYNDKFAKSILKKAIPVHAAITKIENIQNNVQPAKEAGSILAGTILLNDNSAMPAGNRSISLINKNGQVIKSTYTNRYGNFVFSSLIPSEIAKLRMDFHIPGKSGTMFSLINSKRTAVAKTQASAESCEWVLNAGDVESLTDNQYTTNIGGKLVSSSAREKKFFAGKTIYLSNKFNTVLQKTKTNLFGTFVFEDIKPDNIYYIGVDKTEIGPGEKIDILSKEDNYIATLDTVLGEKTSLKINASSNKVFNDVSVGEDEMKMDVKATIFGDNVNTPIGKLKIILLNDRYEVIDSALTDNLGTFKFKYLPFLKRFYLSAENTENMLDVFKNILIYSSDDNLIKIMTHQKGTKFSYNPVNADMSRLRDIEIDDPWLEFVGDKKPSTTNYGNKILGKAMPKSIVENILFENNKYEITPQSKEILDKIILVLNTNKNLKLEIGAHTDSKGSDAANLKLSEMRARTVRDYIIKSGMGVNRIISKGYGETKPRNTCGDNCTETEHAQNRRIEFKIIGE